MPRRKRQRVCRVLFRLSTAHAVIIALVVFVGCRLDILRVRDGRPVDEETFEQLQVGETTVDETLDRLGAPDQVEYKPGLEDEYHWYRYTDEIDIGLRFRLPTPLFLYQHNFLRVNQASEQRNELQLVFDDDGVLRAKSSRVADAYGPDEDDRWKIHVMPRVSYGMALFGDGGVRDYNEIFDEDGFRVGVDLGLQPVPIFLLFIGGHFQQYQGRKEAIRGQVASFDDLEMFDAQIGVRMTAPVQALVSFTNFEYLKRLLFDEELNQPQGVRIYVQGSVGATFSDDVPVKIDGIPAGNFYDESVQGSSTVEGGFEYGWGWGLAFTGVTLVRINGFDSGDSPLEDDAGTFQSLMITGGLSVRL